MIHDILLSLISADTEPLPILEFTISELSSNFIHPGEAKILEDIVKIAGQYKDIRKFITKYNGSSPAGLSHNENANGSVEEPLSKGLYLQAFCDGMDASLEKYRQLVIDLEKRYLRAPTNSLLFIFHQIDRYQPLLCFLLKLISGIRSQRLHGCMILDYLQRNSLHGNKTICEAVQIIQRSVYVVFIKHLYQWLLYGRFVDPYGEFFIQHVGDSISHTSTVNHSSSMSAQAAHDSHSIQATIASDTNSINTELWRYEVAVSMLPYYFPYTWAENVLMTGQTVLTFNSNPKDMAKKLDFLDDSNDKPLEHASLWGDQEYEIFRKFYELQNEEVINVSKLEQIVNVIKTCVTEHLFVIAMHEANLSHQMRLIKDFYLLGRGELFHEFIKYTKTLMSNPINEASTRDLNRAFSSAGNMVGISEDIEQFSMYVPKDNASSFTYEANNYINFITLKYKVKFPLHLLFAPKVLDRYNEMFRFLLKIKKTQFDLEQVWTHHREIKFESNTKIVQFRNKLLFLIDNLQYYLQVDVLESQFSILMNAIQEAKDFEHIHKAHSKFQSSILGLCFLIPQTNAETNTTKVDFNGSVYVDNPVLTILNKILACIHLFCTLCMSIEDEVNNAQEFEFQKQEEAFDELMDSLLKLLVGMRVGPLSQLLLRLDFNYWFSLRTKSNKIHTSSITV
ncbi:gamma-tubulin complex component 4 homolog [Culicoides brevitarsis]|uniref:gamma-tubulin complex component 4 homolog n=1 Tax=Culicoides brevitarsis TaxID=469753 RepID=UPI00307B72DB